jgi:glucokinase
MVKKEFAVGIDIGGTNTVFGYVDREGVVHAGGKILTTSYTDIEEFVRVLHGKIASAGRKLGNNVRIKGYGIGVPMGNINRGTIEHAAGLPWKGIVPLADIFHERAGLPVFVTNDANAAAVGEMIYGGAKEMKNFVVITLGTGLGSGFVVNGKLVHGHDGFAGEIGHTPVCPGSSDRECGCGRKGCLETYVSATGLKRSLVEMLAHSNQPSRLRGYSFNKIDSRIIFEAAKKGDKLAKKAFDQTGTILGYKLADVAAYTNPEAIFLLGGLALAGSLIFRPAKKSMEDNLLSIYKGKIRLLPSGLNQQNAAVLGSSSLVWSNTE